MSCIAVQVAKESGLVDAGATTEFSGLLFQPVPWSPTTKHGMPQVCALFFFTFTCNSMDFSTPCFLCVFLLVATNP
jgi:hypothetical protein